MKLFSLALVFVWFSLVSCKEVNTGDGVTPSPSPILTPAPVGEFSLSWDDKAERHAWSLHIYAELGDELLGKLSKAKDLVKFCPTFEKLEKDQKKKVFGELIVAMSKFESGWNPQERYVETAMGTDPVTGSQVVSEGLLQLSYQDVRHYKFCEFDWSKDKALSKTDPKKTIFDPLKNLSCGLKILGYQVEKKGAIILSKGVYWSVLREGNPKAEKIRTKVSSLEFCK